jgi:prepilin-type N-terminal cleavage/methylation domain-containing protein
MKCHGSKGFTLLEVLIVICIAGILSGFTYLGKDILNRGKVMSVTNELLADIQSARMSAMTGDAPGVGIRFESATSYVIFEFTDCNNDFNYDLDTCSGFREEGGAIKKEIPSPVVLLKNSHFDHPDNDIVIFDKFGHPRQKNWGMGLMTILIQDGTGSGVTRCISISMNRVKAKKWNGIACI